MNHGTPSPGCIGYVTETFRFSCFAESHKLCDRKYGSYEDLRAAIGYVIVIVSVKSCRFLAGQNSVQGAEKLGAGCGKTRSKASMQRVLANRGRGIVSGLSPGGSSDQDDAHYEDPA